MSKRKLVLISFAIAVIFALMLVFGFKRANLGFVKEGKATFIYDNASVSHTLSEKELSLISDMFNDKRLYKDNLSCGFSENISVTFNNSQTFCIARDTCPIIYWKEKNRFLKLTEEEKVQLYGLLEKHGFFFPCV